MVTPPAEVSPWAEVITRQVAGARLPRPAFRAMIESMDLSDTYTIRRTRRDAGLPWGTVVLTFDDGPNPEHDVTLRLLDVLNAHAVTAAFSLIGEHVAQAPALAREVHDAGHLLVNHTYSHPLPPLHGAGRLRREIQRCDAALARALDRPGYRSIAYRPPGGILNTAMRHVSRRLGLVAVPVTHYTPDTLLDRAGSRQAIDAICADARTHGGGIYVLHERRRPWWSAYAGWLAPRRGADRGWVPDAVAEIVTTLRADGFRFPDPHNYFGAEREQM